MISGYKEEVKITIQENPQESKSLEEKVKQLEEQVRLLRETIEYMNRERSRMKSDLDTLRTILNK